MHILNYKFSDEIVYFTIFEDIFTVYMNRFLVSFVCLFFCVYKGKMQDKV